MTGYTTEEVARLLGLSPAQIRSYTRAGFLSPSPARAAGGRGELRFSFQDLVLLRAAKGLMAARIPAAKIRGSLRRLKQQLPRGRALSELRITAEGHRVVARDGALAWNPDSGQLVLDFDVATLAERAAPLARRQAAAARRVEDDLDAEQWFDLGLELEVSAPEDARDAYRRISTPSCRHARRGSPSWKRRRGAAASPSSVPRRDTCATCWLDSATPDRSSSSARGSATRPRGSRAP